MKNIFFLFFAACLVSQGRAQDAQALLQQSFERCLRIKNGTFAVKSEFVSMMDEAGDTSVTWGTQTFRKNPDNSIFGAVYTLQEFAEEPMTSLKSGKVFNGAEYIEYYRQDTLGTVFDTVNWKYAVQQQAPDVLFSYYTAQKLALNEGEPGDEVAYSLAGTVTYNGWTCWKILHKLRTIDSMNVGIYKGFDQVIYLNMADTLPVFKSSRLIIQMGTKDFFQFERNSVRSYAFNQLPSSWTPEAPKGMNLKPYQPRDEEEEITLVPGEQVPALAMQQLFASDSLRLSDLKGKVVVLDFFYRSCPPCLMAMPKLQALKEKFNDQEVVVIGVNPFDKPEVLKPFLEDMGVSYTIGMIDREDPNKFYVRGYPTLFILDKDGTLLHQEVGYGEGLELEWETIVKEALNH